MGEEPKKEYKSSSISEMSSLVDKIQRQMRPLSYDFEKINMIQDIARQYEHLDPARIMAAAASKVFEESNSATIAAMEAAKSTNLAQSQLQNALASQNKIYKMLEHSQANNNAKLIAEQAMKSIHDSYPYKDMRALSDQWKQSIEPYQSAWDTVRKSMEASESFKIARQLQSKEFLDNSILAEYLTVFEQLESLRNLESFKAVSRLDNIPKDTEFGKEQVSDMALKSPQAMLGEVKRLDEKINKEVSAVNDFNELSEDTKRDSRIFLKYYYWLVMNLVVSLCLLKDSSDKSLDLSKKSFAIVDNIEDGIMDIGQYWNGNKVALFNGFIVNQISKILSFLID